MKYYNKERVTVTSYKPSIDMICLYIFDDKDGEDVVGWLTCGADQEFWSTTKMSDRRTSPQMIAVDHDDDEVDDSFLGLRMVFFICTMVMMFITDY